MKVNIVKPIVNISNLNYNIECYEDVHNVEAYLIMNHDTAESLAAQFNTIIPMKGKIAMYNGNKILIDDDLKYGEVDIR